MNKLPRLRIVVLLISLALAALACSANTEVSANRTLPTPAAAPAPTNAPVTQSETATPSDVQPRIDPLVVLDGYQVAEMLDRPPHELPSWLVFTEADLDALITDLSRTDLDPDFLRSSVDLTTSFLVVASTSSCAPEELWLEVGAATVTYIAKESAVDCAIAQYHVAIFAVGLSTGFNASNLPKVQVGYESAEDGAREVREIVPPRQALVPDHVLTGVRSGTAAGPSSVLAFSESDLDAVLDAYGEFESNPGLSFADIVRARDFDAAGPLLAVVVDACAARRFWAESNPEVTTVVVIEAGVLCEAPDRYVLLFSLGALVTEDGQPAIEIRLDTPT